MKNNGFVKSPLNYTGNKYRVLDQIFPFFPQKIKTMVDLFCGGATVGINVDAEECYFIDNNPMVIGLLEFISKQSFDTFLQNVEKIVEHFNLSNSYRNTYSFYTHKIKCGNKNNGLKEYNKIGFYKLRNYYNNLHDKTTPNAFLHLYVLLIYGFNNDLRFNSKNEYNLPVGKTDLNRMNVEKIRAYIEKTKNKICHFVVGDFRDKKIKDIINQADFIYLDPPYLITDAVYNETSGWNNDTEIELMKLLSSFVANKQKFVLSNVLSKKDRVNEPLSDWIVGNKQTVNLIDIDYHYRSASYNKKQRDSKEREIIVCYNGK